MHGPDGCALEIKQVKKLNGWVEACPSAQPFSVPCAMDVFIIQHHKNLNVLFYSAPEVQWVHNMKRVEKCHFIRSAHGELGHLVARLHGVICLIRFNFDSRQIWFPMHAIRWPCRKKHQIKREVFESLMLLYCIIANHLLQNINLRFCIVETNNNAQTFYYRSHVAAFFIKSHLLT